MTPKTMTPKTMTPLKKTLTAAGLGTAMFVGGVFGVAGSEVPGAGAQEAETPADGTAPESTEETTDRAARKAERRAALAELLGMTTDELAEALSAGSTLAEVAEAQGVGVQELIDFLVERREERITAAEDAGRITEEEAEEKREGAAEKAEAAVNGEFGEKRGKRGHRGAKLATVADALGVTAEELREAVQAGSTIADVAEANGVSVDAVVDALVANAAERVDQAVENGRLTSEEGADKLAEYEEKIEAFVNGDTDFGTRERSSFRRGNRIARGVTA